MTQIPGPLGQSRWRWQHHWTRYFSPWLSLLGSALPRLINGFSSAVLILLLAPLLLLRGWLGYRQSGQVFESETCLGRFQQPFHKLRFAGDYPGAAWALLFNIFKGEMSWVGPRALPVGEVVNIPVADLVRFNLRPGVFSVYKLRQKTGIAYSSESQVDADFHYRENLKSHAGVMLRFGIASILGGEKTAAPMPEQLDFFGVPIVNTDLPEAVDWICQQALRPSPAAPALLGFVNPDCLNISYRDAEYRAILQQAERVLPDGIGIHIGCRVLGVALRANVNGTDLFPALCKASVDKKLSLYLLGARPGLPDLVAENMRKAVPGLRIAGYRHGYFSAAEEAQVIAEINASGADILLVAFGVPKQEKWLQQHRHQLRPKVLMGVGGLFDFYAGRIPRAPQWMREIGMEWIWRFIQEPGRMWRRYIIGNPLFLYRVWRQKIAQKS